MVGGNPMPNGAKDRSNVLKEKDGITGVIRSIIATSTPAQRSAFHVLDLGKLVDLYHGWRAALPNVRPYYAVKCNPDPAILGTLAALGAGFDCASRAEIEAVLALGVPARDIVYANPCKTEPHIEYAASVGVSLTTYDSEEEVAKVKRCHPTCALLLRIKPPGGANAKIDLGTKYGAHEGEVVPLLRAAQRAGLHVAGVSFHIGSGASHVDAYRGAVEAARAAFDAAVALGMPHMSLLDIGGGFTAGPMFTEAAKVIKDALGKHFATGVEVIGEPGRYFAEKAATLAARVIGKRTRGEVHEYWIDDGVYGSLNCILTDHYQPRPRVLVRSPDQTVTYTSTIFGPTCDSLDMVVTGYKLPEMSVGDWLVFDDMGAYTTAIGTKFNGFDSNDIKIYIA